MARVRIRRVGRRREPPNSKEDWEIDKLKLEAEELRLKNEDMRDARLPIRRIAAKAGAISTMIAVLAGISSLILSIFTYRERAENGRQERVRKEAEQLETISKN